MTIIASADLLRALDRLHLLDAEQGVQASQLATGDARDLARALVQRGWLTPHQVNKLFQGKGDQLLLGSYVLLEKLGEGGMGAVFKARNWKLGRVVALKLIRKDRLANEVAVQRFQREIRAAAQLDHPNIVHAFDADQAGDVHFLVMEFVAGTDLARLVKEKGPLSIAEACDYVRQAALGLQQAHKQGLVHRDVKPHNLLLTGSTGVVKILDFGLARIERQPTDDSSSGLSTADGTVMGTLDYVAPEQVRNAHTADIRADLYSLGCTLYHLLVGKTPFPGGSAGDKIARHLTEEPSFDAIRPDVAAVIRKLMAKRPEHRYQTPAEAAQALSQLLAPPVPDQTAIDSTLHWSDIVQPTESETPVPQPHRRTWLKLAAALGVPLVGGLVYGLTRLFSRRPTPQPPTPPVSLAPLDALDPARIPAEERFAWQPRELVAVLGEHRRRHWDAVRAVAVSPDGSTVASSGGRQIRLCDAETMRERAVFEGHKGLVAGLAFSPDGRFLASAGEDGTVRLWNWKGDRPSQRAIYAGHQNRVYLVAFTRDSRLLASAGEDGNVRLWDVIDGQPRPVLIVETRTAPIFDLAISPDGKTLLTRQKEGRLQFWDVSVNPPQLQAEHKLELFIHPGGSMAFLGDGPTFLTSQGTEIRLWDCRRAKEKALPLEYLRNLASYPMAVSADGKCLAFAGQDIHLCHRKGEVFLLGPVPDRPEHGPLCLAFAPDGKTLVAGCQDHVVRQWDLTGARPRQQNTVEGIRGPLTKVAFAPDDSLLVAGGQDGVLRAWNLADGQLDKPVIIASYSQWIHGLAFAGASKVLVCGTIVDGIHVWDLSGRDPRELAAISTLPKHLYSAAVHPQGKAVAVGLQDGNIRIWDLPPGEIPRERKSLTAGGHQVRGLAFSPDGARLLARVLDGTTRAFDWQTGAAERPLLVQGDLGSGDAVAFAPDGKTLFLGGQDGKVRLWNLAHPGGPTVALEGHAAAVRAIVFAADGRLASAGEDGRVILWDLSTRKERLWWQLPGPVYDLAFSRDGRYLATANGNGTVYILRLSW